MPEEFDKELFYLLKKHFDTSWEHQWTGTGDGFYVEAMEDIAKGVGYGYYNRGHLPNTPATTGALESVLNGYLASVNFAPVNL